MIVGLPLPVQRARRNAPSRRATWPSKRVAGTVGGGVADGGIAVDTATEAVSEVGPDLATEPDGELPPEQATSAVATTPTRTASHAEVAGRPRRGDRVTDSPASWRGAYDAFHTVRVLDPLRPEPAGMPDAFPAPPVIAESGDPFAGLRVINLVARVPRGGTVALAAIVDRLNTTYLDWLFTERVVADALLQLQANWMADYRNTTGIILDEVEGRASLTIEDSSRVDPWIARQAQRLAATCREALLEFSRRDRPAGEG